MNYPEFRSTAFVDVADTISDKCKVRASTDRYMTDALLQFLQQGKQPYFAFMFFDASHQPYHFPPEHGRVRYWRIDR